MACPITQGGHKEKGKKPQGKIIMACAISWGSHNQAQHKIQSK